MRSAWAVALFLAPASLAAQAAHSAHSTPPVLLLEHHWQADSADSLIVVLKKDGVYWAEVLGGIGSLTAVPATPPQYPVFVEPHEEPTMEGARVFELHPARSGPHVLRLVGVPAGTTPRLRVYSDEAQARQAARARDRQWGIGLAVNGGVHSGYLLEPSLTSSPAVGSDVEACLLLDSGHGVGGCLGAGYQSVPGAAYGVEWAFAELRAQVLGRRLVGGALTQLGLAFRLAQGGATRARSIDPSLIAVGVTVTQHLAPASRTRGWSLQGAYQHGWLGNLPAQDRRQIDRFTAGMSWIP